MRRVCFTPMAEQDIRDAFKWYHERSPQSAWKWFDSVHAMADIIVRIPELGSRWDHGEQRLPEVRSVRIREFPAWLIVYMDKKGTIRVLRIVHGARDLDAGLDLGSESAL